MVLTSRINDLLTYIILPLAKKGHDATIRPEVQPVSGKSGGVQKLY